MKYFIVFFTSILIASGWPLAAQQFEAAQVNTPDPANTRVDHDVHVENWRVLDIFLYLLRGTGLHGGFVEMAACSDLPKGRLQIEPGLTIQQAMDALVAANPGYQWELKDGVVNMMPRGGAPLLDTRIAKFQESATNRDVQVVFGHLLRLPEVQKRQVALGFEKEQFGQGGLSGGQTHPAPPVQINLQDLSLQEAFNKVVQVSPKAVWIYHETDCNGAKTYIIRVQSDY